MKKLFLMASGLFCIAFSYAKVSEKNIPAQANMVAEINLGKLTQLMPLSDWNKSTMGKELLKFASEKTGKKLTSLSDLGVQLNGQAYFYHTENDSMRFLSVLIPLENAKKITQLFAKNNIINAQQNSWMVIDEDSTGMQIWNNNQLLFVKGMLKDYYFENDTVALNHGLTVYNPYTDYVAVDSAVAYFDSAATVHPPTIEAPVVEAPVEIRIDTAYTDPNAVAADSAMAVTDVKDYSKYDDIYEKNNRIKKQIAFAATKAQINKWFYNDLSRSINENEKYNKAKNNEAVANFWMDEPTSFYQRIFPNLFGSSYNSFLYNNFMPVTEFRFTSLQANLFMNKKEARLVTNVTMTDEMANMQKKITNQKINPEFLNYINTDSVMAYMSYAVNTKAYLELMPQILETSYGAYMQNQKDEIAVGAELISLLLDEEAISKMVKGDALVLFNGLFQKEVTYTDYTYDEDYNSTAIEKKKMETFPKFLVMMSSEQNKFTQKLIQYGINKKAITQKDNYYVVNFPNSPMEIYFLYKNNILFIGNEELGMKQINAGTFKANISAQEAYNIKNNIVSVLVKPKAIYHKLAQADVPITEDLTNIFNELKEMGNFSIMATPVQNNQMQSSFIMDVPAGNNNALTYFIEMVSGLSKNNK